MKKLLLLSLLGVGGLSAQTAQTYVYRAILDPRNEVPVVATEGRGTATVWLHVVRNANGEIISGSVDFKTRFSFTAEQTLTMMHVHRGAAGVNGPVVLDSGMTQTVASTGLLQFQGQVLPGNASGLAALQDVIANPAGFYVNVHSTANPAGVIRGQLDPADVLVVMAQMNPGNEVPAITGLDASAIGVFRAIAQRSSDGRILSAEVLFEVNYTGLPAGTRLTAMHIHRGAAGVNGPVVIDSTMTTTDVAANGNGTLRFDSEMNMGSAVALDSLYGLFTDPSGFYLNVHSTANPGGVMRGQTRNTDRMSFSSVLSSANEVPPLPDLNATAPAQFTLQTIRDGSGRVQAGYATFDVNYRFPGQAQFTGLHVHNGLAGANGPVTIDSGLNAAANLTTAAGSGNIYRQAVIGSSAGIDAMNSVAANPENHYLNLHTSVNPGGAVRNQLAPASTARPAVSAIISANSDPTINTVAPYGLMTLFGTNLMKVAGDNAGSAGLAPSALNGTTVQIAGRNAYILQMMRVPTFVPMDYIVAQVPDGVAAGAQPVVVSNSNGAGASTSIQVAPYAPGLYFDTAAGIAARVVDLSLIRPGSNPALPGELIAVLSTGLGQTTPALEAGRPAGAANLTATVTGTFGSGAAEVVGSQALPGYIGYYWTVVRVPANATGMTPLRLTIGGVNSNTVMIPVR